MHKIQIDEWWFSNLLSYGSNINKITIKDGMIWIKGPNGAGKSAILEALNFIIFGTPYRNINNLMLKNTSNKSPLKAGGQIRRISSKGEDIYIVEREMSNSGTIKTKITKNGTEESKNSITQKIFESEVLGFNQTIFENIISLNTIQTTPFIEMDTKDKRKLVESVLTLHIDKYKKANSNALKEAQTGFVSAESDQRKYQQDVIDLKNIIEQLKVEKENDIKNIEVEINNYEEKIKKESLEKEKFSLDVVDITKKGKDKKEEYDLNYKDLESKISDYKNLKTQIESLNNTKPSIDEKQSLLKNLNTEIEELQSKESKNDKNASTKLDQLNIKIKNNNTRVITLKADVANSSKQMAAILVKVESHKVGTECPTCGKPSTNDDIEKIKKTHREEWKSLKKEEDYNKKEIETLTKELEQDENDKKALQKEVDDNTQLSNQIKNVLEKINSINKDIDDLNKFSKTYQDSINSLVLKLNDKDVKIEDIDNRISDIELEVVKGNVIKQELNILRDHLIQKQEIVKSHEKMISEYNNQLKELNNKLEEKKKKDIDNAFSATEKKLLGAESDLETAKKRITKYSDEISVCKYIEGMYNDDGIKKLVLGIFVPNLNKAIAHNLNMFELPFMIEFDDSMEYRFSNSHGTAPSYNNLSQGQKRKLNFAISIAFRDFVTTIADFKINVLFLDEVLDISTDYEALDHMLTLLKNKIYEIGSIYLMTHRGDDFVHHFDGIVKVRYDGRYSEIEV